MEIVLRQGSAQAAKGSPPEKGRSSRNGQSRLLLIVLSAGLASSAATAQTSLTLFGTVDDGIQYASNQNGHTAIQMQAGGMGSSKWGLTGTEDIGGGARILFKLESGYNLNTGVLGNNGALFGRRAYVGATGTLGTVTVGRQYDASFDALCPLSAACKFDGGLGAQASDLNNIFGNFNISNAIKYVTPNMQGFQLALLYSLGNVPGDFSANSVVNAAATYSNSIVSMAATFMRVSNPATSVWGGTATPTAGQSWADPLTSPITLGYASAQHLQISGAAVNFNFGGAGTVGVLYTNTLLQNVIRTSSTPNNGTAQFNDVQASYTVNLSPAWTAGAAFNYTSAPSAQYRQLLIGTTYALSKRTFLYATSAFQHANGRSSLDTPAVAVNSGVAASNSPNQVAARFGIRSSF